MTRQRGPRGAEALFGAAFLYAMTGILVREVAPMWGNDAQVAARYGLVLAFLTLYGLIGRNRFRVPRPKLPAAISLSLLFALVVLFFTAAVEKTTVANSLFTYYAANMIVSFVLGTLILHEKIPVSKAIALILALAGLSVYSGALLAGSLGLIYGVASGICDGVANVFRKQLIKVDRNAVLWLQYLIGTAFTVVVTLSSGQQILRHASVRGGILTVVFAGFLVGGSYLMLYGFQHFDVNVGTVIMSTELVFASVVAYLLFNELPATHELAGGGLIFAASIVGSGIFDKRKRRDFDSRAVSGQPD